MESSLTPDAISRHEPEDCEFPILIEVCTNAEVLLPVKLQDVKMMCCKQTVLYFLRINGPGKMHVFSRESVCGFNRTYCLEQGM